jgi:hypothetical protein
LLILVLFLLEPPLELAIVVLELVVVNLEGHILVDLALPCLLL